MQVEFKPSFERSLKHLGSTEKKQAQETVEKVIRFLTMNEKTPGLGIKQLRGVLWEARAGIHTRVIFQRSHNLIEFILTGNHDEVKRFLKHSTK